MRVLVLALLAGCYDPGIEDCQFMCGMGMSCPDGSECRNGFCRTTDAPTCANDPCANAPEPPQGCANKFPLLDANGCGVVCMPMITHVEVQAACGPSWRAGILDAKTERESVPVGMGRFWLGAQRVTGGFQWFTGDIVDQNAWDAGFPMSDEDCVYIDAARGLLRNDRDCESDLPYICTYPPTN